MRYSREVRPFLLRAAETARSFGHSYVGSIHMLLALMQEQGAAGQLLRSAGMQTGICEDMVAVLYGVGTPYLPLPQSFSHQMKLILRNSGREADFAGSREVKIIHILLAMLRREKSGASQIMLLNGVDTGALFDRAVECLQQEKE